MGTIFQEKILGMGFEVRIVRTVRLYNGTKIEAENRKKIRV